MGNYGNARRSYQIEVTGAWALVFPMRESWSCSPFSRHRAARPCYSRRLWIHEATDVWAHGHAY